MITLFAWARRAAGVHDAPPGAAAARAVVGRFAVLVDLGERVHAVAGHGHHPSPGGRPEKGARRGGERPPLLGVGGPGEGGSETQSD